METIKEKVEYDPYPVNESISTDDIQPVGLAPYCQPCYVKISFLFLKKYTKNSWFPLNF